MAETGSAVFRAIADWAQLRREAKRAGKDLKDTRRQVDDLNDGLGDLDKSSDDASKSLRKVGDSAKSSDKDVKGLLGSVQQWAKVRAKAVLETDATRARAEIQKIKAELAGLRVTKLQLDADASRVRAQIAEVKAELRGLEAQDASPEIDLQITKAKARIKELEAELRHIKDAKIRVDADTARARAKMAEASRDADALGRKRVSIKVDADPSRARTLATALGAVTAAVALLGPAAGIIGGLAGALFAIASAAAPAAAGLLGVAAAAGAAAQAAAVVAVSFLGVGKAVKALQTRQDAAASGAASSAKTQQASADRVSDAYRSQQRAIEQRNRTAIQGQQQVESAERAVAAAVESAARRIASAEKAHADAVRDVERARADLNRELELAKERMEDLQLQIKGGLLDEESAEIRVKRAAEELARVRRLGGSGLDLEEAQNSYDQAVQSLEEVKARNKDLQKQQEATAKSGVDGDEQVIAARERLADATSSEQAAEAELDQARIDGRKEVEDAERQLSQTIQQTSWANADAQQAVVDATRELERAYRDAGAAAESGGAGKAADDFDKASPAAKAFAQFLFDRVIPALKAVRDEVQAHALPKFQTAIETALPLLDLFGGKLVDTADIIGNLSIEAARMMTSGPWTRDFGTILDSNNRIIDTLGHSGLVAADILRILWVVAGPLAERLATLVLHGLEAARAFLEAKRSSGELADFMTRAGDVIEQLLRIVGNFIVALFNMGKAAAPAGQILLDSLEGASKKFREFTGSAEGQNKLHDYFMATVPVVQELGRLLVDLVKFFGRLSSDPNTAAFIQQLRTDFLPALERMIAALGDKVIPLLISLGSHLADVIAKLGGGGLTGFLVTLNAIATALSWLLSIPGLGEFVGFILTLAGAGAALSLVGTAIGGVVTALGFLGPVLDIVALAVRGLAAALIANPIVAIITGIALAALLIYQHWDELKAWWDNTLWPGIKAAAQAVWDFLTELFSGPEQPEAVRQFGEKVKGHFADWTSWCTNKLNEFWDWANGKVSEADQSINNTIASMGEGIKQKWNDAWEATKRVLGTAWDFINGTSADRANILRGILQTIGDKLGIDLAGAWDRASQKVSDVWRSITQTIDNAVAAIERTIARIQAAWDRLKANVSSGISTVTSYIPGFAEGGMVGGSGPGDNQIIKATAGEWVVPRDITSRFLPFLKAITFGSARSVAQIIQPEQARLIQDRLAGVPDLSALSGLGELLTTTRGANTTAVTSTETRGVNVVTNIYNPIAEPGSDSVADRMRTLSLMGVFS